MRSDRAESGDTAPPLSHGLAALSDNLAAMLRRAASPDSLPLCDRDLAPARASTSSSPDLDLDQAPQHVHQSTMSRSNRCHKYRL